MDAAHRAAAPTSGGWPPTGSEDLTWTGAGHASTGPGITAFEHLEPFTYRAAVPPTIAGRTPQLSTSTAAAADEASRELSRFDGELGHRVAGFAPVLLRSESASSSQIEQLSASARSIFTAELTDAGSGHASSIVANTRTMQVAIDLADDPGAESILRMHRVPMAGTRHTPGAWRTEAVWIGTGTASPRGAEFVAPRWEAVPALIDDLAAFAARSDLPPLVHVAVAHAQFETIHPFTDGNGRTGRAFAQSMLRRRGVTRNVAVPVSAGLLADVAGYHAALGRYREGDVDAITLAFAEASMRAVENSRRLVADLDGIREHWNGRLTARRDASAWRLLDLLVTRPVIDASTVAAELGLAAPNAYRPIRALEEAGILVKKSEHGFGPVWRSPEVLGAIDAFARRAGRRERA